MTPEEAARLREPFPESVIGKLPRVTCPKCRESRNKVCEDARHAKAECADCGNWITRAHIHLDYVGHAAVTDRLLKVDPDWTWAPMARHPETGAPLMADGGLWIELTVCGITRPGYGDGPDPKERIGDALRNAAMRFGVAVDLWAKQDLHAEAPVPYADPGIVDDIRARMSVLTREDRDAYRAEFGAPDQLPAADAPRALAFVVEREQIAAKAAPPVDEASTGASVPTDDDTVDAPMNATQRRAQEAAARAQAKAEATT